MNQTLKSLTDAVLKQQGVEISNGEVKYFCPFCHHRKRKLQVNFDDTNKISFSRWNCWVCKKNGNLLSLFKLRGATQEQRERLRTTLSKLNYKYVTFNETDEKTEKPVLTLPEEYIPLTRRSNSPDYKNAIYYARKKRGLSWYDITKYQIGYCENGEYAGKLIIPSFDENGVLNYFVGRAFYDVEFGKHKNPTADKNVIGFELFINWQEPIILVEGVMDAITIKRNAIPIFGKIISPALKMKIITKKVSDIYIALDPDAIKEIIPIAEEFMNNGIRTYILKMGDKDPNELGMQAFMDILYKTQETTLTDIMKMKLEL